MTTKLVVEPEMVFGRLTVLNYGADKVSCQCSCGNFTIVRQSDLVDGTTRSCGCLRKQVQAKRWGMFNAYLKATNTRFIEEK